MEVEHLDLLLDAKVAPLLRGLAQADAAADKSERNLARVKLGAGQVAESDANARRIAAAIGRIPPAAVEASAVLGRVKLATDQAVETAASADVIDRKLAMLRDKAMMTERGLGDVKLTETQAAETRVAADQITDSLQKIERQAVRTRAATGGGGRGGIGMVGLLGAAVGGATLLGPAAAPAGLAVLAGIPALAAGGVGVLGTLALAFDGVGKAIGGDEKAFDDLTAAQQRFVLTVRSLDGWLDKLKQTAAENMFPGLTQALHSALSPGTVDAVTTAVAGFARAIGQAGAEWGRYFGSPAFQSIFGPLMAAGARGLSAMSDAALRLFDSVGVLARAGIPLETWLTTSIDRAARLADSWLHARDASGQLRGALDQAQASLRIVGGLLESVGRVVGALGKALYPVSQVAVRDLTAGLDALAKIIDRNQQTIRQIVGGALAALVATVKAAAPIVAGLATAAVAVAKAVGGWKTAFEIVIGGMLALKLKGVATAIGLIPSAAVTAETETVAAFTGIGIAAETTTTGVGALRAALLGLGAPEVLAALAAGAAALAYYNAGGQVQQQTTVGGVANQTQVFERGGKWYRTLHGARGIGTVQITAAEAQQILASAGGAGGLVSEHGGGQGAGTGSLYSPLYGGALQSYIAQRAKALGLDPQAVLGVASAEGGFSGAIGDKGTSFGPFQLHQGGALPKGQGAGFAQSRSGIDYALAQMAKTAAGLTGMAAVNAIVKNFERPQDGGAGDISRAAAYLAGHGGASEAAMQGSPFGALPAWTTNVAKAVGPKVVAGANLLPAAVRNQLSKLNSMVKNATGQAALDALTQEKTTLENALAGLRKKLAGASGPEKTAIKAEETTLENKLRDVNSAIKGNLQAKAQAVAQQVAAIKARYGTEISTLQSSVSTYFGRIQTDVDAALQAKFQQQADALGRQYYQGGLQTPAEAQLAAMQAQDTVDQLQQQLTDALASGDAKQIAAARRAIAENQLAAQAAAERAKADQDYAAALEQLQERQRLEQEKLDDQLAAFGAGLQTGKTHISDLNDILKPFGISLADIPADQLTYDMNNLSTATQTLAQVMLQEAEALANAGGSAAARATVAAAQGLIQSQAALAVAGGLPAKAPGVAIRDVHAAAVAGAIDSQTAAYLTKGLNVLGLAAGGAFVTNGPTPIVTGEGGERELVQVTPLSRLRRAGQQVGGDGVVVNLTINGVIGDRAEFERFVRREVVPTVRSELLRVGKRNVTVGFR